MRPLTVFLCATLLAAVAVQKGNTLVRRRIPVPDPENDYREFTTDGSSVYPAFVPHAEGVPLVVHATVLARHSACVALSQGRFPGSEPYYYIALDGWANKHASILRRCTDRNCELPSYSDTSANKAQLLNSAVLENGVRWVHLTVSAVPTNASSLLVTVKKNDVVLLSWEDPRPLQLNFVVVKTHGNVGYWIIHRGEREGCQCPLTSVAPSTTITTGS